ncbi:variable surface protein, partial [Plasmodium gonderi]
MKKLIISNMSKNIVTLKEYIYIINTFISNLLLCYSKKNNSLNFVSCILCAPVLNIIFMYITNIFPRLSLAEQLYITVCYI